MKPLIDSLRQELDALSLDPKEERLRRIDEEVRALERELDEVQQRIGFWDRVLFFDDTEDEARARSLEEQIEARTSDLEELRETVELDREALAAEYPPYDLARRIHRCRQAVYDVHVEDGLLGDLTVPEDLPNELEAIGETIVETWIAEYDPVELRDVLADPTRREVFADDAIEFDDRDAQLGWGPIGQRRLIAACATAFDEERHRALERALAELQAQSGDLETSLVESAEEVSLLDKLNFLTTSPEEAKLDAVEQSLTETEREIEAKSAALVHVVESTIGAFPPLAVQIAAHEALGAVRALHEAEEPRLSSEGAAVDIPIAEGRPLVVAALLRLGAAYRSAFPEVPTMLKPAPRRRRGELADEFAEGLEGRGAYRVVETALTQAHLASSADAMRDRIDDRVSWLDRAVFWSDTEDEATVDDLDERIESYRAGYARAVRRLMSVAREEGTRHPPLALRDWALYSDAAIAAIHTDGGQSSVPKNCSVYGREDALHGLSGIRTTLEEAYGFEGGRRSFVRDVADCLHRGEERHTDAAAFEVLPYDEIVARVAGRLTGTGFGEFVDQVEQFESAWTRADAQRTVAEADVSIWDRINIFTTTESEARRDELEEELDQLGEQLDVEVSRLDRLIEDAMAAYPPARLYYRLQSVEEDVRAIRAVCRSRTVTVGSGENRRTETRYYCDLVGKGTAVETMRWWNRTFLDVFGRVPDYRTLLEYWLRKRGRG